MHECPSDGELASLVAYTATARACRGRRACQLGLAAALLAGVLLAAALVHARPRCKTAGTDAALGSAIGMAEVDGSRRASERADAIIRVLQSKPVGKVKELMAKAVKKARKVPESAAQHLVKKLPLQMSGAKKKGLEQERAATCAFNIIWATQMLARAATLIQSSMRTCPEAAGALQKICAINAVAAEAMFSHIGFAIANAVSSCAATASVKALCGATSMGLVTALSDFSAGGITAGITCKPGMTGAEYNLPPGSTPANLRGPPSDGRRLFLGGGNANFVAQCALDATETAWSLAAAALGITAAAKNNCPPIGTGAVRELSTSTCAFDISVVLFYFARLSVFVSLAMVHCTDALNIPALCSAGIETLIAGAAAFAVVGNGFYITCDKGLEASKAKRSSLNSILAGVEIGGARRLEAPTPARAAEGKERLRKLVEGFGYNTSDPLHLPRFDNVDSALKALQAFDEYHAERLGVGAAALKRAFRSPEDVWQSLGFNISNPRSQPALSVPEPDSARFVELMEPVLGGEGAEPSAGAAPPPVQKSEWSLLGDKCL